MMYSVFGFNIPVDIIVAILVGNSILLVFAFVGFRNLKLQIRELKNELNKIKDKQKEIKELQTDI